MFQEMISLLKSISFALKAFRFMNERAKFDENYKLREGIFLLIECWIKAFVDD